MLFFKFIYLRDNHRANNKIVLPHAWTLYAFLELIENYHRPLKFKISDANNYFRFDRQYDLVFRMIMTDNVYYTRLILCCLRKTFDRPKVTFNVNNTLTTNVLLLACINLIN